MITLGKIIIYLNFLPKKSDYFLTYQRNIPLHQNWFSCSTHSINHIHIYIRPHRLSLIYSVPCIRLIVYLEVAPFKKQFSPPAIDPERLDEIDTGSSWIKYIVLTIVIRREYIREEHLPSITEQIYVHRI